MPDIEQVILPNNVTYDIADATARSGLSDSTTVTTTPDTTPYLYKAAEHNAVYDKLVGGTVAWNQLAHNFSNNTVYDGACVCTVITNGVNINGSLSSSQEIRVTTWTIPISINHVYLCCARNLPTNSFLRLHTSAYNTVLVSDDTTICKSINTTNDCSLYVANRANVTYTNVNIYPQMFDLTAMFGSTIANYIYSLEQATEGAGVAWFRNLFPKSYYAYNAGSLQSVKTSAHKMVGKNLVEYTIEDSSINNSGLIASTSGGTSMYDMQVAKVIKGKTYTIKSDESSNINTQFVGGFFYNKPQLNSVSYDGTRLANTPATFTAPIDGYVAFRSTHGYTIAQCEFGSLQTAYEPYVKTEYVLDSNLELRGISKLDTNNKLYYDGDIYESSGKVTRKYWIIDLGSLTWYYIEPDVSFPYGYFWTGISDKKIGVTNIICSNYVTLSSLQQVDNACMGSTSNNRIYIVDSIYNDAATFKTAMSGVYLIYELATPTTESSTPFANPQTLYSKGTEEYIDERAVAIPVGGDRTYVDIPDWMQNRYFDDIRSESSLVPEIINEVNHRAEQKDLTNIFVTGTKNNTGSVIPINKFFYLNGELVCCKQSIDVNATLTENTNYIKITAGILNGLYNVLQDVTPTSSDKLLVVQSQSQGLVPYGSKLDSDNPTGTGKLSMNRASGSTEGVNSIALGTNSTASGSRAFTSGQNTVASGDYTRASGYGCTASGLISSAEGQGTIANHLCQHAFGRYNVADTSTAAATAQGNYIEIVGKGANGSNRSNARTLDWSGNEVLAGDLTYKGNQVLSSMLMSYTFKSGSPITLTVNRYTTLLVIGFAQSIGSLGLMVVIGAGTLSSVINLATATAFSSTHLTFSLSNNVLTIASDNANDSVFTIIRGS